MAAVAAAAAAVNTPTSPPSLTNNRPFGTNSPGMVAGGAALPAHLDHWLSLTSGAAMAYHQAAAAAAAAAAGYPPGAPFLINPALIGSPLNQHPTAPAPSSQPFLLMKPETTPSPPLNNAEKRDSPSPSSFIRVDSKQL